MLPRWNCCRTWACCLRAGVVNKEALPTGSGSTAAGRSCFLGEAEMFQFPCKDIVGSGSGDITMVAGWASGTRQHYLAQVLPCRRTPSSARSEFQAKDIVTINCPCEQRDNH